MKIKYKVFKIPKNSGKGFRTIEQPDEEGMIFLKEKLIEIEKMPEMKPSFFAHAFMRGRNIVTCAKQHHGKKYIARIDVKDFFGTITFSKFSNIFMKVEMGGRLREEQKIDILDKIRVCFKGENDTRAYLPQGSPTSPYLSNVYLRFFDWRCAWVCYKKKIVYNRYADDIYLSSDVLDKTFHQAIKFVYKSIEKMGLKENRAKRKIMKNGRRMNVVGIVVNDTFQVPKKLRKTIRAIKHNAIRDNKPLTKEQKGLICFENMVKTYSNYKSDNLLVCGSIDMISKEL